MLLEHLPNAESVLTMATCEPVDFLSVLPLELVVNILLLVRIKDVLSCMSVCKGWYDTIRHLHPYWSNVLRRLGAPPSLLQDRDDSFRLAVQVWMGRQYLSASIPEIGHISQFHQSHYYQCNYCRHGTVVATLYNDFIPFTTIVSKVQLGSKKLIKKNQYPPIIQSSSSRICWASVYSDYILMATASGRWLGYSLTSDTKLLDWTGYELYDQDITICCCDNCFIVSLTKLSFQRKSQQLTSYWNVKLLTLGRGQTTPRTITYTVPLPIHIAPSLTNYGCKSTAIIPFSRGSNSDSFCSCHLLLLQWANCVSVYRINESMVVTPVTVFYSDVVELTKELLQSTRHRNSSLAVSFDNTLTGFVFCDKLYSWNLEDGFSPHTPPLGVTLQRSKNRDDGHLHLLALGRIYTLIGYDSTEGLLQVVTTYTGDCVFSTHGFSGIFHTDTSPRNGAPPPYFIFLGVVDEHWLNDVNARAHPHMPAILYWEKKEHGVFGIMLKQRHTLNSSISDSSTTSTNAEGHTHSMSVLRKLYNKWF